MNCAHLKSRKILRVSGEEAESFLQGLITCNLDQISDEGLLFGALLTPQGKVLFDFFVHAGDDGMLIDIDGEAGADFMKRLMFYRLRAPVEIEAVDDLDVYAAWDGAQEETTKGHLDPRLAELGARSLSAPGAIETNADEATWNNHRIALGMPASGADFAFGDVFPHDVMMDCFSKTSGVDFTKGCYVGQEVVSRMQHRGTARRRFVKVAAEEPLSSGTDLLAGSRSVGTIGSVAGATGLALVRIDRVASALADDTEILADNVPVTLTLPAWSGIEWPST
ncbi:MAG: folate-binding protein [Pseudomonadota bacterium]